MVKSGEKKTKHKRQIIQKKNNSSLQRPPSKKSFNLRKIDYLKFLEEYSTDEDYKDKDRYQKVKITSIDKFDDCLIDIKKKIKKDKDKVPFFFCGLIDGVDEILSAYANLSASFPTRDRKKVYGIFIDINPHKIDYLTFRLLLTQLSDSPSHYLRNLFYHDIEGEKNDEMLNFLDKAYKNNPSSEQHRNYLLKQLRIKNLGQVSDFKPYISKGIDILNLIKQKGRNYKSLAKMLKANLLLNPETHWILNDRLFNIVKNAFAKGLIKVFQGNLNRNGKVQLIKLIKKADLHTNVVYVPKGTEKFSEASDLIGLFDICVNTRLPPEKTSKYRIWHIIEPERFFVKPSFKHRGELSSEQLMDLARDYKDRGKVEADINSELNVLLVGDVPFGRSYMDARSTTFLKNVQKYAALKKIPNVVLCGDVLDGEHAREKRKLAFLQYLTESPMPSIEQQCEIAKDYLSRFSAQLYSVTSDGDWDIIEEKQRELINEKEFQYKVENNSKHIPDDVKKSLRIEAIFESAKQYYEYFESHINLSAKLGDNLNLNFLNGSVDISHMSLGQYFRRSLAKKIGAKEQMLINQLAAMKTRKMLDKISIKVSSHDNVLHAHMENENTLNLRVPSLESPDNYEALPIQIRNAVQDMMHKAFAVRGKIPFPGSCHVKVTPDYRILMTVLNERCIEILKEYQPGQPKQEFLIFDTADSQIGSIAYKHEQLIKFLDYVKFQAKELAKQPNTIIKRIALFNGDVIEGINYPTAMMRNAPTKMVIPQTQITYATEVIKPFFFHVEKQGIAVDEDMEKFVLTHGNHEVNSGFNYSGMVSTHSLYQYLRGQIERDLSYEEARKKLTYSLYTKIDKDRLIFSSTGAFSCLGLNLYCTHSYGGGVNEASASPPQEKWVTKIGDLSKKWDILIQGHYHKFSLGECAGKILLTFPSFTEISDFEYERGLNPVGCKIILHISNTEGVRIEILTKKFLDNYKCRHPLFKRMTIKQFHDQCTSRSLDPVDLSEYS